MLRLFFGLLFFPIVLPFLVLRFVFRLMLGLLMLPIILLVGAILLLVWLTALTVAVLAPLTPFIVIALIVWAVTRHSRAASAYPG